MGVRRRSRRLAAMITVAGLAFGAAACGSGSDIRDQYPLPLIAANDPTDHTVTAALSLLRTDPEAGSGAVLACAVIALLPGPVVHLLLQRSPVTGIAAGVTKS